MSSKIYKNTLHNGIICYTIQIWAESTLEIRFCPYRLVKQTIKGRKRRWRPDALITALKRNAHVKRIPAVSVANIRTGAKRCVPIRLACAKKLRLNQRVKIKGRK